MQEKFKKHVPNKYNWVANEHEYVLVFCLVDGIWVELGHDIEKYRNITLSSYLALFGIDLPNYTQYLRINAPKYNLFIKFVNQFRYVVYFRDDTIFEPQLQTRYEKIV